MYYLPTKVPNLRKINFWKFEDRFERRFVNTKVCSAAVCHPKSTAFAETCYKFDLKSISAKNAQKFGLRFELGTSTLPR